MQTYRGALPVTEEWHQEHVGEMWEFNIPYFLTDLIDGDWEAFSETIDMILGFVLTDFSVYRGDPGDNELHDLEVMLLIAGVVSEF